MARVVLERLSKVFPPSRQEGPTAAIQDVSLEIGNGELMVLVGPSGGGKSTTLRLIAGLDDPTGGTIRIDDQIVNTLAPREREVAMVFQSATLYPHLTAQENLTLGLELRKMSAADIRSRLDETAEMLEIAPLLRRLPHELSGGQQQRVAVGRALMRQPKVLLLDEPLSHLDTPTRQQLRLELARWHQQLRTTTIYVTHDQAEAMALGQRVAVMKEGVLQQACEPIQLYEKPANTFVAGFIGSPPMNLFSGRVETVAGARQFAHQTPGAPELRFKITADYQLNDSATVTAGLRPEAFSTRPGPNTIELEGRVDRVELHGPETWWHVSRGAHRFIVRLPGTQRQAIGATTQLHADVSQCHYFDSVTGMRLTESSSTAPSTSLL